MNRRAPLFLAFLCSACSATPVAPPPPAPSPPPPAPVASAPPSGTASAAPPAAPPPEAPTGVARLTVYDGPTGSTAISEGRAWTLAPMFATHAPTGTRICTFDSSTLAIGTFMRASPDEVVFERTGDNGETTCDYAIPGALTVPAVAAHVGNGAAVLVEDGDRAKVGRVAKVAGDKLTISIQGESGAPASIERKASEVLALDGTARFGAPVAYRREGAWHAGLLAATNNDDAWVVQLHFHALHKAKKSELHPMPVNKPLAKGAKIWRYSVETFKPGVISAVLEGSVYEVTLDDGKWKASLDEVIAPIE